MTAVLDAPVVDAPATPPVPAPARAEPPVRRPRTLTFVVVATVTALVAWVLLFELVLSGVTESRDQHTLYAQLRQGVAAATSPIGGAISPGTPVALISAPAVGLNDVVVVEGTSSAQLRQGPGHLRDTALPGQPGTSVLLGRSATFGAPFRRIGTLATGAVITVVTAQGTYSYHVTAVRRPGQRYVPTSADGSLELITSEGSGLRAWAPDRLVYVHADLAKGQVQPAPPGRPATVPTDELAMKGDTGLLTTLVLWLQAMLLVGLGIAWSLQRWGRSQALLIGAPVLLACLWGATETAATLLPNLV